MSQDKHFNAPDPEIPESLQDRKGTDMPSARTIVVVILATISAVVIFFSIRLVVRSTVSGDVVPAEQGQAP